MVSTVIASYHLLSQFDCRRALDFEDPFLRRTTLKTPAGELNLAVVSLGPDTQGAAARALEAVAEVAAAIGYAPLDESVQRLTERIRQPLREITTQFFEVLAVHAYARRRALESAGGLDRLERSKPARLARAVLQAFESAGDQIYTDSAEVILGHLAVMGGAGAITDALAQRLSELVIERAIALTEFVAEFLDLPKRSAQGLAYLLGISDNSEVFEIENVAISIRDDDEADTTLLEFMSTRTTLNIANEGWRQALKWAIWQSYGLTEKSWTTAAEPFHYLLRTTKNLYRREYLRAEIPIDAVGLPPDDLLPAERPERFDWKTPLAISPQDAIIASPNKWGDTFTEIDIKTVFEKLDLGEYVPRVLERYAAAERESLGGVTQACGAGATPTQKSLCCVPRTPALRAAARVSLAKIPVGETLQLHLFSC